MFKVKIYPSTITEDRISTLCAREKGKDLSKYTKIQKI